MYSKFQFFSLPSVTPRQCQKFPVPADLPALSLSQSCACFPGASPVTSGVTMSPWPGSCLRFGSSLVTSAEFLPSGIVKDPSLYPCQEEISPFRSAVSPQFSPWSLLWCPLWWPWPGAQPCAPHSRTSSAILILEEQSTVSYENLPFLHLNFASGNSSNVKGTVSQEGAWCFSRVSLNSFVLKDTRPDTWKSRGVE